MESDLAQRDVIGVQDAVLLEDIHSESIFIDNLEKRFKENLIYTYIGPVLISVNPYKELSTYDAGTVEKYRNVNFYEVPPHVFAVSDTALRAMRGEHADQCILISGESGSGKTEASKKILQFIAAISHNQKIVGSVKEKLLQSNPVLEAFGNAKTNRNNNSSRFGKYMDTEFSSIGEPVGGHILNYLLEKSRVVYQAKGERNFHIFYQLLAGADDALLANLQLTRDPSNYFYTKQGESSKVRQIDDAADFKLVNAAMKVMDLEEAEIGAIFRIIATILHLGNVNFGDNNGRATLDSKNEVNTMAKLLDCSFDSIENALLNKTIDARGDVVTSPLTRDEALYARDALAKAIYGRLFDWLVRKLNESLTKAENQKTLVVGILDIYGFEIFEKNSFEQFCINYCNEKLQQLFIELTLKSEQEEYLREGIQWEPIKYFDNKIIVDLVEEKHKGIIAIMDEECLRPGESSDRTFLAKMNKNLTFHPHFISHEKCDNKGRKTIDRDEFRVLHYAGEVTYNVNGFLDKNNDLLFRDLKEAMSNAKNIIAKETFTKSELTSKKRPDTAASQFKNSLGQLSVILKSKEPSYIRCIKPNDDQVPNKFNRDIVSHQVKYLGLMENLRVRRAGFAYRRPYEGFLNRYKALCPATWPHLKQGMTPKEGVQLLANHLKYGKDDYRMGKTKIFIRLPRTLFETEDAFQKRKNELLAKIQAIWKGRAQRKKYLKIRARIIQVQAKVRKFLAKRRAQKRRWAVAVIRGFIQGFIARNETPSDANKRFLQFVRFQYLLRLSKQLPKSVLEKDKWPERCPKSNSAPFQRCKEFTPGAVVTRRLENLNFRGSVANTLPTMRSGKDPSRSQVSPKETSLRKRKISDDSSQIIPNYAISTSRHTFQIKAILSRKAITLLLGQEIWKSANTDLQKLRKDIVMPSSSKEEAIKPDKFNRKFKNSPNFGKELQLAQRTTSKGKRYPPKDNKRDITTAFDQMENGSTN
ncbi:hypothetical protein QYM36_012099, partial [Artemia franciscana]